MRFDIMTLFPELVLGVLGESVIGRAQKSGAISIFAHNIRDYSKDKHRRVDDATYGGGLGMLMQVDPIYDCFCDLEAKIGTRPHLIYMSPQGKTLTQERVKELSQLENIAILCGHYEGVDERVIEEIVDEEISVGDCEAPTIEWADEEKNIPANVTLGDTFELKLSDLTIG